MVLPTRKTRIKSFIGIFLATVATLSIPSFTVPAPSAIASPNTQPPQNNPSDRSADRLFEHQEQISNQSSKSTNSDSRLQKTLIDQNNYEQALLISERSKARGLRELLNSRFSSNTSRDIKSPQTVAVNPPSIEQIKQIAVEQNATLVQYSIINDSDTINNKKQNTESELYVWVIKPTGEIKFNRVDLKPLWQKENSSLQDLVINARNAIGVRTPQIKGISQGETKSSEAKNSEQLQKLYQLLIAPIADYLPKNPNEKVIFMTQGVLHLIPFPALQNASGKYLIEQHAISTSPSIQLLGLLRQQQQRRTNIKDVLVVGNYEASIPPKPGEPPQKLPSLPGAEKETKAVTSIFNTQPLTGKQATKAAVLKRMPSARIIHFVTHMLIDDVQGSESAIALSPSGNDNGLLTVEEIVGLKLNAELVVLSACDSATGRITGDGVIGLSRAFIVAGASSVMGSLWTINDQSTVYLMAEFYKNLQENPVKSQALQKAILSMKKKYPNPRDWAAFTLVGDS